MIMSIPPALIDSAGRFRAWMRDAALPVWAQTGWDSTRGGFHERFDLKGQPDSNAVRRVRSQARQIYVYAHADHLGWFDGGNDLALRGLDWLTDKAWSPDGEPGWVARLSPDGDVIDPTRDLYEQAFALLALAWIYRSTGEARALDLINETLAYLDEVMAHPAGGWLESVPDRAPPRRQNPHMHMFEASLALFDATQDKRHLERAAGIHEVMRKHWIAESGSLLELFDADWSRYGGKTGTTTEPGHQYEWVWLLDHYRERTGADVSSEIASLYAFARTYGRNSKTGLIMAAVAEDGAPMDMSARTWQQTEHLKASLIQGAAGRTGAWDAAGDALHRLFARFLAPAPAGCWIDAYDADGRPDVTGITASTLYHLFVAAVETKRVLSDQQSSAKAASR